jgi:hypothetical protein
MKGATQKSATQQGVRLRGAYRIQDPAKVKASHGNDTVRKIISVTDRRNSGEDERPASDNVVSFPRRVRHLNASVEDTILAAVAARLKAAADAGEHLPFSEVLRSADLAWYEHMRLRSEPISVAELRDHTTLERWAHEAQAAEAQARGEDMLAKADDYSYRRGADEAFKKQEKRWGKGPKLDEAPGAPEPDPMDFRNWDGTAASALYIYRDAHGVPHTIVARWNLVDGKKKVIPYYWGEGPGRAPGWVMGRPPHPILYRLPEVLAGVRDGKTIVFLEGEKDVEGAINRYKLEERGFVVTTTLGGALNNPSWNAWGDIDYSPLSGADVIIIRIPAAPAAHIAKASIAA